MTTSFLPPGLHRQSRKIHSSGSVATLRLPHFVAVGARPGPTSAVVAGQHGREIAGMVAAAEAFQKLDSATLAGTVHFFPTTNPLALQTRRQDFPLEDSRYRKLPMTETANMDRLWGSGVALDPILSATTEQLWENPLRSCQQILDLHGWSSYFCPMAWAHERDETLLRQTGFPFVTVRRNQDGTSLGTLRERAWQIGMPIVVAELPGQNTVTPEALKLGVNTIRNFLIAAGHLDEPMVKPASQILIDADAADLYVELPVSGIWKAACQAGDLIQEGAPLGEVLSLENFEPIWTARAPQSGLVLFNGPPIWGEDHREHQIVYPGQRIATVKAIRLETAASSQC